MIGHVDRQGRAMLKVSMGPSKTAARHELDVWIDTGFNGDLVLSQRQIEEMGLPHSGTAKAVLADGSRVSLKVHVCIIHWFGELRELNVVANDGEIPLLGVGLLAGHDLHVSYRSFEVRID